MFNMGGSVRRVTALQDFHCKSGSQPLAKSLPERRDPRGTQEDQITGVTTLSVLWGSSPSTVPSGPMSRFVRSIAFFFARKAGFFAFPSISCVRNIVLIWSI